jgi:hypothetical protein
MFDLLKQDVKKGDRVKLYLTTGKEPEGIVIQIGENFILLQNDEKKQNRFFDKLIGGWDIIQTDGDKSESMYIQSPKESPDNIIDKKLLITNAKLLLSSIDKTILKKTNVPNANIIEARGTTCIASNSNNPRIVILNSKIFGSSLITEIETFKDGSIIPVVISLTQRDNKNYINAAALPDTLEGYLQKLMQLIENGSYNQVSLLLYILKKEIKFNKYLGIIISEIKKIHKIKSTNDLTKIQVELSDNPQEKKAFKNVEKEINNSIKKSQFEYALSQIEQELSLSTLSDKYKSNLLLKKAQIYSSLNRPDDSEKAYQELVLFNEKIHAPSNNLSHLYTELSRLQALKVEKQDLAIETVKKALQYNPNNKFAINLLKQFEGKYFKGEYENIEKEQLLIEAEDEPTTISKMIDLDIKEHKYTHPEILRNGGRPTAFIARQILTEAKKTRETDLSERFPIYLEAAKAFSELNIGSYDLQDFLESAAYYSYLKGNSLFINSRNRVFNNELDLGKLTRLRDSACSYYIESLNLLSNIEPRLLVTILANYLKLNLVIYHIENNSAIDYKIIYKGQFAEVFKGCLRNENRNIEVIAYDTIISCGASSIQAWNRLAKIPNGTAHLYGEFSDEANKSRIFDLINELEGSKIDQKLTPGEFLRATFKLRKKKEYLFFQNISKVLSIEVEPHKFETLINEWKNLAGFEKLLTKTDSETKIEIDRILSLIQPYLNRNQSERTNILILARNSIEKQIKFINDNTTYYGRTFFFGLLNKWKREVDILLEEKIAQSYPSLSIMIDPPYYIETEGKTSAPLIIKNEGEATSEGFILNVVCEAIKYQDSVTIPYESTIEIASGRKHELNLIIPQHLLADSTGIEISIDIIAVYQKKKLTPKNYQFTVEKEPESRLTYEDVPWREGVIPPEYLFKGRKRLIADLSQHYLSTEKDKPYILYGLTRTGKSSVLEYLRKDLEGDSFISKGSEKNVITFSWDFSEAANHSNAADFYNYILYDQTFEVIEKYFSKNKLSLDGFIIEERVKFKHFKVILEFLANKNIYPIFFIDEFSFIKPIIDKGTITSAFLHSLRQFALNGLASFIFSGTYDIKSLIRDPKYGITGQLVNAIEYQINEISADSSIELIKVIDDKVSFTPEAIQHIMFLSGRIPYFIQIICKYCGYYACENKRRNIGYPELEKVVRILIGQETAREDSLVKKLPENIFQNNQFSPSDPKEVSVLTSSLAYFNKNNLIPRGVGFHELEKLWADQKLSSYKAKLADAISILEEKKIIIKEEDEGIPVYKLSVDLFRRWWSNHYTDIDLILTSLILD